MTKNPNLGEILTSMRCVTPAEVEEAARAQEEMSEDELLGAILLSRGLVEESQLAEALRLQRELRSGKPHRRALAAAKLAAASAVKISAYAGETRRAAWEARKRTTGEGYRAITPELLAGDHK